MRIIPRLKFARVAWGLGLILSPGRIISALGSEPDRQTMIVARLLGIRHLVVAALLEAAPSPPTVQLGAATDALHALTALAFGATHAQRRRAALFDGAIAATWAAVSLGEARRMKPVTDQKGNSHR